MRRFCIVLPAVCLLLQGCTYFRSDSEEPNWAAFDLEQVQQDMRPLELGVPYEPPASIQQYFRYYHLDSPVAEHYFGTLESEGETLVVHVYLPPEPRGSIFLVHGYFDHTGTLSNLIREGIERGYAIAVWDLPGHGLSTGLRTDTGEFDLCAGQLGDVVLRAAEVLPDPFYLIAHSTGASITMEYMHNTEKGAVEKVVFLSPLIRHAHWRWGRFGYAIAKPFTQRVRRREKKNSSDEAYLAFVKQDPLHSGVLSFEYLRDLYDWEKATHGYPVLEERICIIQGDKDAVVDWRYNLDFLRTKISDPEIHLIPGARHQLVNESEEIQQQVFDYIFTYLNEVDEP